MPKEELGFEYADIVGDVQKPYVDYKYLVYDEKTGLVLSVGTELIVNFDFRDWRYLTNIIRSFYKVTDVDLLLGQAEGEIDVDFSRVVRADNETGSRFEVGGRVYWEAYVTSEEKPEF